MTISMYKVSVPIFAQLLTALSVVLDKAAAHAEAKQLDPVYCCGWGAALGFPLDNTSRIKCPSQPLLRSSSSMTNLPCGK
jgi:hypothetical protein